MNFFISSRKRFFVAHQITSPSIICWGQPTSTDLKPCTTFGFRSITETNDCRFHLWQRDSSLPQSKRPPSWVTVRDVAIVIIGLPAFKLSNPFYQTAFVDSWCLLPTRPTSGDVFPQVWLPLSTESIPWRLVPRWYKASDPVPPCHSIERWNAPRGELRLILYTSVPPCWFCHVISKSPLLSDLPSYKHL